MNKSEPKNDLVEEFEGQASGSPILELQKVLQTESTAPEVDPFVVIEVDVETPERQFDDHRFLARFFAGCACLLGLITIGPAVYGYAVWFYSADVAFPRWAFLMLFAGLLHVVYAVYVSQITDYSALQMLSAFWLMVTCGYGFLVAALLLNSQSGIVVEFLQLPFGLVQTGAIWCGIMFCISALCCYLSGRESMIWQWKSRKRSARNL